MLKQTESHNKHIFIFSGRYSFWAILNDCPISDTIEHLNGRSQKTLLRVLREHIEFCFKGADWKLVLIHRF